MRGQTGRFPDSFERVLTGRSTTLDAPGKLHCPGVAVAIASARPYRGESLVQSVSHRYPAGAASKGDEAGCNTWRCPKFTNSSRSSFSFEKYRRTKLVGLSTAPSIPAENCSRN